MAIDVLMVVSLVDITKYSSNSFIITIIHIGPEAQILTVYVMNANIL